MWEHLGTASWAQRECRMLASLEESCARGLQPGPLQVVQKIKASGNQVLLAVLDGDSYEAAKALGRDLSQMLPTDIRPRLCHITRDKSGFGFSVSGPEGREAAGTASPQHRPTWSITPSLQPSPLAGVKGTFQLSVRQDGPAERAGVPSGSWLLELNGHSVRSCSHTQLARKVCVRSGAGLMAGAGRGAEHHACLLQLKQSGSKVTLLVASGPVEEFYRLRGLQVTAALADTSWLPFKARELHMVKGDAGYGFLLKEDDYGSGDVGKGADPTCAQGQQCWDVL